MNNNYVRLVGTVKRDAEAQDMGNGVKALYFALEVESITGRLEIFDCKMTDQSPAYEQLEGFVSAGEPLTVIGHLEKRTYTNSERLSGAMVEVRNTTIRVYVDYAEENEE